MSISIWGGSIVATEWAQSIQQKMNAAMRGMLDPGHVVAFCEKDGDKWKYKLMLKLYAHDPPEYHPYQKWWSPHYTYEGIVAKLTKLTLTGEIKEIKGLGDADT